MSQRAGSTTGGADGRERLRVVVVDDERPMLAMIERKLGALYDVVAFERAEDALAVVEREDVAVLIVDQSLTGSKMQGDQLLAQAHAASPHTVNILLSGQAEQEDVRRAINQGHIYAYIRKPWRDGELRDTVDRAATLYGLGRDNRRLMGQLESLNAQLEERVREATAELESKNRLLESLMGSLEEKNRLLSELAVTDELTGLYNRRYVRARLDSELERRARYDVPVACLIIDIDDFKRVNDTWGHPVGDRVLVAVADVLRAAVRRTDVAGRYGGEEFVVVCASTGMEGAVVLAERIRVAISEIQISTNSDVVRVTASIGIASTPIVRGGLDVFVEAADTALYEAKRTGKDKVVVARGQAAE